MTMLKMGLLGLALGSSLLTGAKTARADERFDIAPRPVDYGSGRPVVSPAPNYGYGRGYDHAYGYGRGRRRRGWQDPTWFGSHLRAEEARAAEDLRFDVRQGVVDAQALTALEADRQEIERDFAEASAKGYLTAEDRSHLETHIQEIRDLRDQYQDNGVSDSYGYDNG